MTSKRSESLGELTNDHVTCRSFRHAFIQAGDIDVLVDRKGNVMQFTRKSVCVVCSVVLRVMYEVPSMRRIKAKYDYQDGYLLKQRTTPSDAKQEFLDRMIREGNNTAERAT